MIDFKHLLKPKKRFPWPEDAILGRGGARLIGVKLNDKPYVGVCWVCKLSYRNDIKKKWLPFIAIFEDKHNYRVCLYCGNDLLRNLVHQPPPKKNGESSLEHDSEEEYRFFG